MKFARLIMALLMVCTATMASAGTGKPVLYGDQSLRPGDYLFNAASKVYILEMKLDGSIAIVRNNKYGRKEIWNPGVFGQELLFQYDGNLVLSDAGRQHAIWTINKGIFPNTRGTLDITSKGALVAADVNRNVLWKTDDDPEWQPEGPTCPSGQSQLYPICVGGMNLVIPACDIQDAAKYAHQQGGNYGACH
ncbi:phage integrase-like catalytic core domain-containing protein [Janthinobacterium sp. HH01]|uniref:phage integrase-like catalytic core domain-containing protein n=1 Tax=Janthinobacterium sp. HH01 TaxID=1198452 RepID=UPI0002AED704|nr:phage integrase-like catalytic core domain-containing protein [Janthinobacterium sp. HH01]ELX12980.1 phage integrase-like catalytic core domain-containing protein [Janthinobacterium sp. HH01]